MKRSGAAIMKDNRSEGHIRQISSLLPARESSIFSVLANENYNINQVVQGLEEEFGFIREKR